MEIILIAIVIIVGLLLLAGIFGSQPYRDLQSKKDEILGTLDSLHSLISTASTGELRDIVIRLDKVLGDALRIKVGREETVGGALKQIRRDYNRNDLNAVWIYHKMRNSVVHDAIDVTREDVSEMYRVYSSFIKLILK